jgi:hypothetical protein
MVLSCLRAGQKAVMDKVPCHGDIFHVQHQCQAVVNSLEHQEMKATTRRQVLEKEMTVAKQKGKGNRISQKLTQARRQESEIMTLNRDVKTLIQWLNHDVLELAGLIKNDRICLISSSQNSVLEKNWVVRRYVHYVKLSRISATIFWHLLVYLMANSQTLLTNLIFPLI